MRITVPNKIKFSYQYTRGSYQDSIRNAENVITNTIDEIIKTGNTETISVKT